MTKKEMKSLNNRMYNRLPEVKKKKKEEKKERDRLKRLEKVKEFNQKLRNEMKSKRRGA